VKWSLAPRLAIGLWLAWSVGLAISAPELSWLCGLVALGVAGVTLWLPAWGLAAATALVPAGALFADGPAHAAELFAWAFLASWLLAIWRPLCADTWPRLTALPAALVGAALATSWLSITIAGAAGVPWTAMPQLLFASLPRDYLVFSGSEPETWTLLQSLTGIGLFLAAMAVTRENTSIVRPVAFSLAGSLTALAVATPISVGRQWAATGYADWFLTRFTERGERFSIHMADVNAAGSLYVLAVLIAVTQLVSRSTHRRRWVVLLALLTPAIVLAGSRSSYFGIVGGAAILAATRGRGLPRRVPALLVAGLALSVVLVLSVVVDRGPAVQGGATQSAHLRAQFLRTSARMFTSSPMFGVGVGHYFERSAEYMTPALRELYGNENAHNYFAQQFSELGVTGGLPFLWLIGATAWAGWRRRGDAPADLVPLSLLAGAGGYLLTCVTGHPLLVPEAALPFWVVFGAVAGTGTHDPSTRVPHLLAAVGLIALLVGLGRAVVVYHGVAEPPAESGFHGVETDDDDVTFRWMTRHSVTYIPDGSGFLTLRLRAPDLVMPRPLVLETSIAGRVADRRQVSPGGWTTVEIPARPTGTPFRRVDFRTNQVWTQEVRLGQRAARRPITVKAADIRWMPLQ
jgi:hypothetical protein